MATPLPPGGAVRLAPRSPPHRHGPDRIRPGSWYFYFQEISQPPIELERLSFVVRIHEAYDTIEEDEIRELEREP